MIWSKTDHSQERWHNWLESYWTKSSWLTWKSRDYQLGIKLENTLFWSDWFATQWEEMFPWWVSCFTFPSWMQYKFRSFWNIRVVKSFSYLIFTDKMFFLFRIPRSLVHRAVCANQFHEARNGPAFGKCLQFLAFSFDFSVPVRFTRHFKLEKYRRTKLLAVKGFKSKF